jgi:hypothetical protein
LNIEDFAAGLREMADNADRVAKYHDVAEMDQLRVANVAAKITGQRNGDLIAELRRQVEAMGRSLDAIGTLRRSALAGEDSPRMVQILADALLIIAADHCESFTGSHSCRDEGSGKNRTGDFGSAGLWCDPCIALDALKRAEPALELEAR